ncbi:MFS transporter [Patescibacteria group bacterium]|nr:MFS transporter [Patescibacteria group bacterium]MBU1952333.1 MFS transporter [Patescibacteria group bacterium]
MAKYFHLPVPSFFPHHITRQIKELYWSRAIMDFAVASVSLFEPIYIYTLGYSLKVILLFYIEVYIVYFIILPLGAKYANKFGYEHSMTLSTIFLVGYYLALYAIGTSAVFLVIAPLFFAINKSLYWTGYHADFAKFSSGKERGKEIGEMDAIDSLVYIVGPLVGGAILAIWNFNVLFIIAAVLILASSIPLLTTKEKFKMLDFSYQDAYQRLFSKKNRRKLFAYIGFGEELIVMVVWPVFIYVVVTNFFSVGMVVALATFTTTFATLYIGKLTDKRSKRGIVRFGSISSTFIWLIRLIATAGWHIFLIDSLSRITKKTIAVPLMAMTYDRAQKHNVMKSIVNFELALVIGKLLAAFIILILLFIFPASWGFAIAFIIGGSMTLLYVLL